jgi:hypothetical protein
MSKTMFSVGKQPKTILQGLAAILLFGTTVAAQIAGLCNTGQTPATASGCTGVLVSPNANGYGTPNLDGNWEVGFPWPNTLRGNHAPCLQESFVRAASGPPDGGWLSNSVSTASEWIMPVGGGYVVPEGFYIYRTKFPVPSALQGGGVPIGVTINGQLSSDNETYWMYIESSPGNPTGCSLVSGQEFPVNPGGSFATQWFPISFTNTLPLTSGADAYLYIIVQNGITIYNSSAAGLRVEFFATSVFN